MSFIVLNDFMEKYHNNTVYRKGDTYPQDGFEADSKRVEFLQEVHPKYGVPFLDKPVEIVDQEPKKDFPGEPESVNSSETKKTTTTKRTNKSGDK